MPKSENNPELDTIFPHPFLQRSLIELYSGVNYLI